MSQKTEEMPAARDFVDAADVRGMYLYRKDGFIMSYLRIFPFNFDLLSKEEQKAETDKLTAKSRDDRKNFIYFTLPREIDLDGYKNFLIDKHTEEYKLGRRHIISVMIQQAAKLSTSGNNYEHQHFIRIWAKNKERAKAEEELKERIMDFKIRYEESGIMTKILDEKEITKLCNLFGNALQAGFESVDDSTLYTPVMQL